MIIEKRYSAIQVRRNRQRMKLNNSVQQNQKDQKKYSIRILKTNGGFQKALVREKKITGRDPHLKGHKRTAIDSPAIDDLK